MRLPGSSLPKGFVKQGRNGTLWTLFHRYTQGVHRPYGFDRIQSEEVSHLKALLHPMEGKLALRWPINTHKIRQTKGFLHRKRPSKRMLSFPSHPQRLHQRSHHLQPSSIHQITGRIRVKASRNPTLKDELRQKVGTR